MRRALLAGALALLIVAVEPAEARRRHAPEPTPTPTLAPIPTPTRLPDTLRVERLRATVARVAAAAPGRMGIAIVDLSREARTSVRGDAAFALGDLVRLAIATTVYRRADQRSLDLDAYVQAPGDAPSPRAVDSTYAQNLAAMLVHGDRAATARLLGAIGGVDALQGVLDHLGASGIDARHGRASPNAIAAFLSNVAQQRYTKLDSTNELLLLLTRVPDAPGRFRAGLPPGASFAHVAGSTSDAGILTFPDGRRVVLVAMMESSPAAPSVRDAAFAQIAAAAVDAYAP